MENTEKFIYKKMQITDKWGVRYFWYLIDPSRGEGVHFHGQIANIRDNYFKGNKFDFFAMGIEAHFKEPKYEGQGFTKNCDVTGGNCYCDGSSLAADRLNYINPNDAYYDTHIWNVLHEFFDNWILNKNN
jgi:hypothetical protein